MFSDQEYYLVLEQRDELLQRLAKLEAIVKEQAEDEGLWFVSKFDGEKEMPVTIGEAYLQQELRRLHAAIEEAK